MLVIGVYLALVSWFFGYCDDGSRSGEMADATVSKTVEGQPSCRFESDLRHHLPSSVVVAQGTLDPYAQVRPLARQLQWSPIAQW